MARPLSTLFLLNMNAAKIISDAIVGNDFKTVIVNNKPYTIYPPTIHKIAGAASCFSSVDIGECNSFKDIFMLCKDNEMLAKALSWMIKDNESLAKKLSKGTNSEVVEALLIAFSLVSTEDFLKAVSLMKNVQKLTAKQKL